MREWRFFFPMLFTLACCLDAEWRLFDLSHFRSAKSAYQVRTEYRLPIFAHQNCLEMLDERVPIVLS